MNFKRNRAFSFHHSKVIIISSLRRARRQCGHAKGAVGVSEQGEHKKYEKYKKEKKKNKGRDHIVYCRSSKGKETLLPEKFL